MHHDNTIIALYRGYIPYYDQQGLCYAVGKAGGTGPCLNWSELTYDTDLNTLWPVAKKVKEELEMYGRMGFTTEPSLNGLLVANDMFHVEKLHAEVVKCIKVLNTIKQQVIAPQYEDNK